MIFSCVVSSVSLKALPTVNHDSVLHNRLIPATTSVYRPLNTGAGNNLGPWKQRPGSSSHLEAQICSIKIEVKLRISASSIKHCKSIKALIQNCWLGQQVIIFRCVGTYLYASARQRKHWHAPEMGCPFIYNNLFVLWWLRNWNVCSQCSHCLVITLLQPSLGPDGNRKKKKSKLLGDDSAPAWSGCLGLRHVCLCSSTGASVELSCSSAESNSPRSLGGNYGENKAHAPTLRRKHRIDLAFR